ncbi:hypothetical protein HYPSUDRAFT_76543 [Hypholoma sublateritium FD-334 SS-4]|uniref:Uncharacterized protein n=1 Tax=Hypholoma sublateritium (strain FD-334 SS-4) TaxID=945553 RepID=A0A0D2LAI5_HYPSF|nr:hypothetical protein HYPSUDRAFT_76543 [Hypholoma sublateritium FD-334 SS-4]
MKLLFQYALKSTSMQTTRTMSSHSSSCNVNGRDHHHISNLNPIEWQPPAKRVKRLFYDPEHMPTMEFVFSEYDSKKGTFAPSLQDAPPSPSFRPHSPSSQYEMSPVVEDPSYYPPRPPQFTTSSIRSGLDERALSNQLQPFSLPDDVMVPCRSSFYPCSPISREDSVGSPLQESMDAYAEADRAFQPFPSPSVNPISPKTHAREEENVLDGAAVQSFESTESLIASLVFSEQSRGTTRGRSSTWSSDVTTVGPSSLPSIPEHKGILFDRFPPKHKPVHVHAAVHRTPSLPFPDDDDALAARFYAAHFSQHITDKGWDTETITDAAHPDDERLRRRDSPGDMATLYEAPWGAGSVTRASSQLSAASCGCAARRSHSISKKDVSGPLEADGDGPVVPEEEGASAAAGARDGRFTTMASVLRHSYVGLSYKVRLALFRAEKTMVKKLHLHRRTQNVDSFGGGDMTYV